MYKSFALLFNAKHGSPKLFFTYLFNEETSIRDTQFL